ncbi:hypothetical protein JCM8547_005995 [Rhodosporidiobolus lusitaniae]
MSSPSTSSSSTASSPAESWRDATSSPYSSSSPLGASTSSSSLWTASSSGGASSSLSLPLSVDVSTYSSDDDSRDERFCLELLAQLEEERERVAHRSATHTKQLKTPRQRKHSDVEKQQEDVFGGYSLSPQWTPPGQSPVAGPSTYQQTRRPKVYNAPKALAPSSSMATIRPSESSSSILHSSHSRRLSFTRTDIADLDIDAILDSYAQEIPFEEPALFSLPSRRDSPSTPNRPSLPRSKSIANLRNFRHDIFPAPPVASPALSTRTYSGPEMPPLTRTTTGHSTKSAKSMKSHSHLSAAANTAACEKLFPHRRVCPFPTMPRKKSSTSLRSVAPGPSTFDLSQAPPLPPLAIPSSPSPSTRSPRPSLQGNRAFSAYARQSTCSTSSAHSFASSSAASFSPPLPSNAQFPFLRQSYTSSIHSSSASSSRSDSIRWSVATSSTAPSSHGGAYSDAGDACSRRGSVVHSPVLGAPASPVRRGSHLRFRLADELAEDEDEDADVERDVLPSSRFSTSRRRDEKKVELPAAASDDDSDRDAGGLISWEDFASELEALAPPPSTTAKRAFSSAPLPFSPSAAAPPLQRAQPQHFSTLAERPSRDLPIRIGTATSTPNKSIRGKLSLATLRVR